MPNENTDPISNPDLIHYNLFFKSWHFKDVQYKDYFWKYAKTTPFYEELKSELDNYTDKQRIEDRAKLDHMLEKENITVVDPNNWIQVKNKGERIKL